MNEIFWFLTLHRILIALYHVSLKCSRARPENQGLARGHYCSPQIKGKMASVSQSTPFAVSSLEINWCMRTWPWCSHKSHCHPIIPSKPISIILLHFCLATSGTNIDQMPLFTRLTNCLYCWLWNAVMIIHQCPVSRNKVLDMFSPQVFFTLLYPDTASKR